MLVLLELLIQIDVAAEAAFRGNLLDGKLRVAQEIFRRLEPKLKNIGVGRHAGLTLEGVNDVIAAVAARIGKLVERQGTAHIL